MAPFMKGKPARAVSRLGFPADGRSQAGVRAVERSLSILACFTREVSERTLEDISQSIGLPKSTTHRLLWTLINGGFVDRGSEPGTYRLGLNAAIVGGVAIRTRQPKEDIHRVLENLRTETGETIGLSARHGKSIVIIDKVESRQALRYDLSTGSSAPAHCTASGKVLLSGLPDVEVEGLFSDGHLPAYTHNSITKVPDLLTELATVRRRGFAVDNEELAYGLRCVAVPIRGPDGRIESALAVSGPSARLSPERLVQLARPLHDASEEIATHLSIQDVDSAMRVG